MEPAEDMKVVLESEDFGEVSGAARILHAKGIKHQIERPKNDRGALSRCKRILVAAADHANALEIVAEIRSRRIRSRELMEYDKRRREMEEYAKPHDVHTSTGGL